jgi:hypothetical protein
MAPLGKGVSAPQKEKDGKQMFGGFVDPDRGPVEPVSPENLPDSDGDDAQDQIAGHPSDSLVQSIDPF